MTALSSLTAKFAPASTAGTTLTELYTFKDKLLDTASLLLDRRDDNNYFGYELNASANWFFFAVFLILLAYNTILMVWSRYHWYNITFFCGFVLEAMGFLGRVLAIGNTGNISYYIMQSTCLTLAPLFFMAGIYFIFAQFVVFHGRQYSVLKPMWYSYFFIGTDLLSLVVQAGGGGMSSSAGDNQNLYRTGTWIMFGGVLFQVIVMTIFLGLWTEFLLRLYFHDAKRVPSDFRYTRKTVGNFFRMFFNVRSARIYKDEYLERFYNPQYASIRSRHMFKFYPLAISISVIAIYVRCVYRVAELKQGFSGYLAHHEVYLLVLDASFIAVAGFVFVPFHPMLGFGRSNVLKASAIKKGNDLEYTEMSQYYPGDKDEYEMNVQESDRSYRHGL